VTAPTDILPPVPYLLESFLQLISGPQGEVCERIWWDHQERIITAPYSTWAQAWPGGFKHHVEQTLNSFQALCATATTHGWWEGVEERERFRPQEGMVVLFVCDLDAVFAFEINQSGVAEPSGEWGTYSITERKNALGELLERYGLEFTPNQQDALKDLSPFRSALTNPTPLGALCLMAKTLSLGVLKNYRRSF
jgi:hypothetical protein